ESGADGGIRGLTAEPQQLDVSLDRTRVWTTTGGGPELAEEAGEERTRKVHAALQVRVPVKAGSHLVQVYFVQKTSASLEDLFDPYLRRDPYRAGNGEPGLSSVTIAAPGTSPGSAMNDSPSRRRLLVCRPASASDETRCATTIIATFMRRAYRRAITEDDLQTAMARYRDGRSKGGFELGLELAVRSEE